MKYKYTNNDNYGVGFLGLLGLLFIGLKLAGIITWSWWLVLLPLYIYWAIAFVIMIGAFTIGVLITIAIFVIEFIRKLRL